MKTSTTKIRKWTVIDVGRAQNLTNSASITRLYHQAIRTPVPRDNRFDELYRQQVMVACLANPSASEQLLWEVFADTLDIDGNETQDWHRCEAARNPNLPPQLAAHFCVNVLFREQADSFTVELMEALYANPNTNGLWTTNPQLPGPQSLLISLTQKILRAKDAPETVIEVWENRSRDILDRSTLSGLLDDIDILFRGEQGYPPFEEQLIPIAAGVLRKEAEVRDLINHEIAPADREAFADMPLPYLASMLLPACFTPSLLNRVYDTEVEAGRVQA